LYRCTIAPLHHCTIAPLHHCTIAPLLHRSIAPSLHCSIAAWWLQGRQGNQVPIKQHAKNILALALLTAVCQDFEALIVSIG
jgi:hypothetical protein